MQVFTAEGSINLYKSRYCGVCSGIARMSFCSPVQVCGQKWADISEHGVGLSVLTDSKYGYSAVGGVLRISL